MGWFIRGFPGVCSRDNADMTTRKKRAACDTPMPFIEDYLPALMAQAQSLISQEFHEIVRQRGFTVSEWRVLASLAGSGPVPIGRLAQFVVMKQPTVTRVLDRQEARGEIRRIAHGSDRRITLVSITPKGTRLVAELIEQANAHQLRVMQPLGLEQAATLKATLRQLIAQHEPLGGIALHDIED